jgi:hypothetical protein
MIIHTSEQAISRLPQVQLDSSFSPRDIVHMILAGGPSLTLYNLSTGLHQRAVDFLCRDSGCIQLDSDGAPAFVADLQSERVNESLGMLAVSNINFKSTLYTTSSGNEGSLEDLAEAAMNRFRFNSQENSWSLMLFAVYPGVKQEWRNLRGEIVSVEKILESESSHAYGKGACFGTHRLEGIAFALRRFCLEEDIEPAQLGGTWAKAYEYVQGAITRMRANQRDDGSLPKSWFMKKSFPVSSLEWKYKLSDLSSLRFHPNEAIVYPTGHCLDALSPIMELFPSDRDWVASACYILAQTIETGWAEIGRKVSALTHAIHAIKSLDL